MNRAEALARALGAGTFKMLVVKPSSLGDVIHALPFLNAVRRCFPSARIHWVVDKAFAGVLEGHQMIEKLWVIDKDSWRKPSLKTIKELAALRASLKKEHFDIAVDLQGLLRSALIVAASGAGIRLGLKGFKEAREGSAVFYTHSVETSKSMHAVDRYLKAAEFLGCNVSVVEFPLPRHEAPTWFEELSKGEAFGLVIAGARWPTKRWPSERFGELVKRLSADTGVKYFVTGTKDDEALAGEIVSYSGGAGVSIAGRTTLKELIGIVGRAGLVISTDSGPMHIASALGVPVVALFGPTSPERTGPYGKSAIVRADSKCAPCFKRKCADVKCMEGISVEMAYDAVKGMGKGI